MMPLKIDPVSEIRRGDYIQTFSGLRFYPLDPRIEDIDIRDIAHALALCCRYTGHCLFHYSIATHSVLVSRHVPPEDALWGLLHDASEAYLIDVPRPIKPMLSGYREIEKSVEMAVARRFQLTWPMPDVVKKVDTQLLINERRQIMAPVEWLWQPGYRDEDLTVEIEIPRLSPEDGEKLFLDRFHELTAARDV